VRVFRATCFALVVVCLHGCSGERAKVGNAITTQDLANFEKVTSLKLPPSAEPIFYEEHSRKDKAIYLQVEMSAADVSDFVAQAPFSKAEWSDTKIPLVDMKGRAEWTPSAVNKPLSCEVSLPTHQHLTVLIDDSELNRKVVYLRSHSN
jgi:hypothetical protein